MSGPNQFLGAPVRITTTYAEELEGELYCYDVSATNSLILRQQLPNGRTNFKWVRGHCIRELTATGPACPSEESLPPVDLTKAEQRAEAAEREAQRTAKNWGAGVTQHAQEVFNAMIKTMDAEWDKEDILVFGVRITKPYLPENCSGDDPAALERVKKVLQGEVERINMRSSTVDDQKKKASTIQECGLSEGDQIRGALKKADEETLKAHKAEEEGQMKVKLVELLLPFFRGVGKDAKERTLWDLREFDTDKMETCHDYIQWMFPTDEESNYNLDAPVLTADLQTAFKEDPGLRRELRTNLDKFCVFLGLEISGEGQGTRLAIGTNFESQVPACWSGTQNHNWNRITRVLTCLGLCSLPNEQKALFECMKHEIYGKGKAECESSFPYWEAASKRVPMI